MDADEEEVQNAECRVQNGEERRISRGGAKTPRGADEPRRHGGTEWSATQHSALSTSSATDDADRHGSEAGGTPRGESGESHAEAPRRREDLDRSGRAATIQHISNRGRVVHKGMTPQQFVEKWSQPEPSERPASQGLRNDS